MRRPTTQMFYGKQKEVYVPGVGYDLAFVHACDARLDCAEVDHTGGREPSPEGSTQRFLVVAYYTCT